MSEPFIVHSHIPKTGGAVLNTGLLFPMHGKARVYQMYREAFETTPSLPRQHTARAMRSYIAVGHVPFGYLDKIYPEAIYLSIFREPVARFLSFLNSVLNDPEHAIRECLCRSVFQNAADDPEPLIMAVLGEPRLVILHGNTQVRLAGGSPLRDRCPTTSDHLDAALRHIAQSRYVTGIQENLSAMFARLQLRFDHTRAIATDPARPRERHARAIRVDAIRPKILDRLRAASDLDIRLYDQLAERHVCEICEAA